MNFHSYQIQTVETKRKELLAKANAGLSSQEDLVILKDAKELLILENKLKETNKLKEEKEKELEANLREKQRLSAILTELKDLKMLTEEKQQIIEKQQYTLSKLSQLLPIEEKLKEAVNSLECKLKSLEEQANLFFESHQTSKAIETTTNSILLEKVSQILEKPVANPADAA